MCTFQPENFTGWVSEGVNVGLIDRHVGTYRDQTIFIVQELCESRGGRPGLSVLTSLLVSVDVKLY